ncbi:non-hydrolyzing UDP-N-acetylglucosamine 2-epimerase [Glacieibacterium sp.]|uniref:non-hydrolyzing UDP-N-acetylglucosamine 2-epimerase n=1 Tax=Glacieibacterium sp. TaxID=2860237 RepID=UPI003B005AC9
MRAPILCVVGTRPEAIKLAPLMLALADHRRLRPLICATGQHGALLDDVLEDFGLVPAFDLRLMRPRQSPADVVAAALPALMQVIDSCAPAAIVAQGDTATSFAAAQAAGYARRPLVHVEAGLRSGSIAEPFPEELHRRAIAQLATLHFAPTQTARSALLSEGIATDTIHVSGNSGIDALKLVETRLDADAGLRRRVIAELPPIDPSRPLLLVTAHRRENRGAGIIGIATAARRLVLDHGVQIVLPVHPSPEISGPLRQILGDVPGVHLVPPLGYPAFVWLLRQAVIVLTDSGGIQEEAPALGVPVLVTRRITERDEGLASGNARLVGTDPDTIVAAVLDLLGNATALARMSEAALPYGDGSATPRMIAVLDRLYGSAGDSTELLE